ncbi:hypothetical protein MY11210_009406 [Beauveria gryllotalpidicola]
MEAVLRGTARLCANCSSLLSITSLSEPVRASDRPVPGYVPTESF